MKEKYISTHHKREWVYTVTWYPAEMDSNLEEIGIVLKEHLVATDPLQDLVDVQVKIESEYLKVIWGAKVQLNINKIVKQLQKKLRTIIEKFDENQMIITTTYNDLNEPYIRLEKLLNSVIDAEYYDMEDSFTGSVEDLKSYLLEQKLSIIEKEDQLFLIDEKALKHEINLNCFACTKRYRYGCCCGSPCDLGPNNRKVFDKHLLNIEEEVKTYDETSYNKILAKGGLINSDGSINECDGHCGLLVEIDGVYKCAAHSYALKKEIPIYTLCPLSCLMYPLEIIELITNKQRKIILLTAAVNEDFAQRFSRWGSYNTLEVELRCINKEEHDDIFKKEDYKPVYKVNEGLLSHEFGDVFYKSLEEVL